MFFFLDHNNASLSLPNSPTSPLSPTHSHSSRTSAGGAAETTKDNESAGTPKLRLLRSLGHGAFSAVWLAEDLSQVPLTLVSKKSVRDLRRRASGKKEKDRDGENRRSRGKERDREKEKEEVSMLMSTDSKPNVSLATPTRMDEKRRTEESSPTPRRQPSRLREGLRNMLSFTRSSVHHPQQPPPPAAPPLSPLSNISLSFPLPPMPTLPTMPNTPAGSIRSIRSDVSSHSQHHEHQQPELLGVSRNPSLRSSPSSIASELPVSESGQLTYEGGLRVPLHHHEHHHHSHPDDGPSASLLSLSRDSSLRKFSKRVKGTRPASLLGRAYLDERHGEMGEPGDAEDGTDGPLSRHSSLNSTKGGKTWDGRLVAVKMTPRRPARAGGAVASGNGKGRSEKESAGERKLRREEEERTRVGFVREVEVLKVSWGLFFKNSSSECYPSRIRGRQRRYVGRKERSQQAT